MALIGKIRQNLWFVLILLGLGMAGFIFMDMSASPGGGGGNPVVGKIDGEKVNLKAFEGMVQARYGSSGADYHTQRNVMWNTLVNETIVSKEAKRLGITVSEEEMQGLLFGPNYSPIVYQDFRNRQTGQLELETLNRLKELELTGDLAKEENVNAALYLKTLRERVKQERLQTKLFNMVSKSIYTPTWLANQQHSDRTDRADIQYVRIPFDVIDNPEVNLADADYEKYLSENGKKLETKLPTRTLEYVVFEVIPTSEDSLEIQGELKKQMADKNFTGDDESKLKIMVEAKQGAYDESYFLEDQVSLVIKDSLFNGSVGSIFGPYLDGESYRVAKLLDRKEVPDSIQARHILRNANPQDYNSMKAARDTIEMIKKMIEEEGMIFDTLALRYGMDATNTKGGDLGTFGPGAMVKPFNDVVFYQAKPNELQIVETQFGVHLVEVTKRKSSGKVGVKVAYLQKVIKPSKKTQQEMYRKASTFANANRSLKAMRESAKKDDALVVESSQPVDENGFFISNLGGGEDSRNMVRWAFQDASKGDVSPAIYRYSDTRRFYENKYVVAGLSSIDKAGIPSVAAAKSSIKNQVINQKKGEMISAKLANVDLSDLAAVATTYEELSVDSTSATFTSAPGIGNEPKVLGAAFKLAPGATSKPIVGSNGVYVVKMVSKAEKSPAPSNVAALRSQIASPAQGQVSSRLIQALRDKITIKDNRSSLF